MENEKLGYLYRHIRLDKNEVFYIGIGSDSSFERAKSKHGRNYHWNNVIKKTQYLVEIILHDIEESKLKNKEIEFIKLYGRRDLKLGTLVNLTDGGDGQLGNSPSLEVRKKQSEIMKIKAKNKSYKDLSSKASRGKKKFSGGSSIYVGISKVKYESGTIRWQSSICFHRKGINLGLYKLEEDAAKAYDIKALELFGIDCVLNFPELKIKYLNDEIILIKESKKSFADSLSRPIIQYNLKTDEVIKEWISSRQAEREGDKFFHSAILSCCKNQKRYKSHKGFGWKFKEES